jgi:hypothetical protein
MKTIVEICKPPTVPPQDDDSTTIFLGGSIEMGAAEDWQTHVTDFLKTLNYDIRIFNPRRDVWDSSWEQSARNEKFSEQVNWELDQIERADIKAFYFDPNTKSPVTLLELGLMLSKYPSKCIVCSPPGFWRRGNLEITCARHGVPLLSSMGEFTAMIEQKIIRG